MAMVIGIQTLGEMALKKTIVRLVDDLDQSEAAETVSFALDTVQFTIDLSEKNTAELRALFEPYIKAGQKVSRRSMSPRAAEESTLAKRRETNQKIREWAIKNGHSVAERGRIPEPVIAAYWAAA